MRLIGMLDSPYVRRAAVSFQLLGVGFAHESISVFRGFDRFAAINPVVKAPTLVCDDGETIMDSSLIIDYAESLARRSLLPGELPARQHALRTVGLALAACEKCVQLVYERMLRPEDKRHAPWVERVTAQLLAAFDAIEADLARRPLAAESATIGQDGITAAVIWHFTQSVQAETVPASRCPRLQAFSLAAERLPEFRAAPHGDGTYPVTPTAG